MARANLYGRHRRRHITDLVSSQLREMGATPVADLTHWPDGTQIRVGGVVVARQRPYGEGCGFPRHRG